MIAGTIIGYNRGEHGKAAAGLRKAHGVICLPFVFDPAGWSCRHGLPGPAELRAVKTRCLFFIHALQSVPLRLAPATVGAFYLSKSSGSLAIFAAIPLIEAAACEL